MLFKSPNEVLKEIALVSKRLRLERNWTQAKLAHQSNVSLPVLRKFEQTGKIALESFIKIALILDFSERLLESIKPTTDVPKSMDELLTKREGPKRKRASSK